MNTINQYQQQYDRALQVTIVTRLQIIVLSSLIGSLKSRDFIFPMWPIYFAVVGQSCQSSKIKHNQILQQFCQFGHIFYLNWSLIDGFFLYLFAFEDGREDDLLSSVPRLAGVDLKVGVGVANGIANVANDVTVLVLLAHGLWNSSGKTVYKVLEGKVNA